MRRCAQITVDQHFGALDRWLRASFASGYGDLLLPKPVKGAILAAKLQVSGELRFKGAILA
jgi:hypothetical protein